MAKTYHGGVDLAGPEFGIAGHLSAETEERRVLLSSHHYDESGMVTSFHRLTPEEAVEFAGCLEEAAEAAYENRTAEETRMP